MHDGFVLKIYLCRIFAVEWRQIWHLMPECFAPL